MAAAPPIKFYDEKGTYQGSTHDYPIAALAVSFYGAGATVRLGHAKRDIVFVQGRDGDAGDCFDLVGEAIGNAQKGSRQRQRHQQLARESAAQTVIDLIDMKHMAVRGWDCFGERR